MVGIVVVSMVEMVVLSLVVVMVGTLVDVRVVGGAVLVILSYVRVGTVGTVALVVVLETARVGRVKLARIVLAVAMAVVELVVLNEELGMMEFMDVAVGAVVVPGGAEIACDTVVVSVAF